MAPKVLRAVCTECFRGLVGLDASLHDQHSGVHALEDL